MTKNSNHPLIETHGLTRIYGDGEEIRALDDVSITINKGELVTVMGPSGSGKSTLLNMLGALDKPTKGQVLINGQDLEISTSYSLDRLRFSYSSFKKAKSSFFRFVSCLQRR